MVALELVDLQTQADSSSVWIDEKEVFLNNFFLGGGKGVRNDFRLAGDCVGASIQAISIFGLLRN